MDLLSRSCGSRWDLADARCSIRLSTPEGGRAGEEPDAGDGPQSGFPIARLDGEHPSKTGHLPLRHLVPRMGFEPRVVNRRDRGEAFQRARNRQGVGALDRHPAGQRPQSAQHEPGVEGGRHGAEQHGGCDRSFRKRHPCGRRPGSPCTSLWPPKTLVVECRTTSTPSRSAAAARGWRGVVDRVSAHAR